MANGKAFRLSAPVLPELRIVAIRRNALFSGKIVGGPSVRPQKSKTPGRGRGFWLGAAAALFSIQRKQPLVSPDADNENLILLVTVDYPEWRVDQFTKNWLVELRDYSAHFRMMTKVFYPRQNLRDNSSANLRDSLRFVPEDQGGQIRTRGFSKFDGKPWHSPMQARTVSSLAAAELCGRLPHPQAR